MTLTDILPLVRYLLNDNAKSGSDVFTYNASSVFTLTEDNVSSVTDVLRNDIASGVSHSYSSSTNKVTVSSVLTAGDTVEVQYSYYANYSDTEIKNYIRAAMVHLSITNYYTFTIDSSDDEIYPTPSDSEKNLIATVASILIEPDNRDYRLPDISISVPNTSLPTDEKIRKIVAIFKKSTHGLFFLTE